MAITVTVGRRFIDITPSQEDIEAMSNATACVVTWTTHGMSTGDKVSFSGIAQANWTALNGNSYTISKVNNNSFSIAVDSSAFGAYNAADPGKVGQDFDAKVYFPQGIFVSAVDFYPSAQNDTLVIREESGTGAVIYDRKDTAGGGLHKSTGGDSLRVNPYIKASDNTWTTPGSVWISLEFD